MDIPALAQLATRLTPKNNPNKYQLGYLFDISTRNDKRMREVAFGSLQHMIQDSFAHCHAQRDEKNPAKIVAFYAYPHQNSEGHAQFDNQLEWVSNGSHANDKVNPVVIGHNLFKFKQQGVKWDNGVKKYLAQYLQLVTEEEDERKPMASYPGPEECLSKPQK
ncbi:MAG: hypothetical protein HQM06_12615 [Magnetococcales bacterium]|nr:hypothetical protein [Magnetococcales bacterium]